MTIEELSDLRMEATEDSVERAYKRYCELNENFDFVDSFTCQNQIERYDLKTIYACKLFGLSDAKLINDYLSSILSDYLDYEMDACDFLMYVASEYAESVEQQLAYRFGYADLIAYCYAAQKLLLTEPDVFINVINGFLSNGGSNISCFDAESIYEELRYLVEYCITQHKAENTKLGELYNRVDKEKDYV